MNIYDPLLDYVYIVVSECAPTDNEDGNYCPYAAYAFARNVDRIIAGLPFTRNDYDRNINVQNTLKALGIDIDKYWYALVFIYDYTMARGMGIAEQPPTAETILKLIEALKDKDAVLIVKNDERKLIEIRTRLELNAIAKRLGGEYDEKEVFSWGDRTFRPFDRSTEVLKSPSCMAAYAARRHLALIDKLCGKKTTKIHKVKTVAYHRVSTNRMTFVSRIIYMTRMKTTASYDIDGNALKSDLKQHSDDEMNTIAMEYIM